MHGRLCCFRKVLVVVCTIVVFFRIPISFIYIWAGFCQRRDRDVDRNYEYEMMLVDFCISASLASSVSQLEPLSFFFVISFQQHVDVTTTGILKSSWRLFARDSVSFFIAFFIVWFFLRHVLELNVIFSPCIIIHVDINDNVLRGNRTGV